MREFLMTIRFVSSAPPFVCGPQIHFPGLKWDAELERVTGTEVPCWLSIPGIVEGVDLVEIPQDGGQDDGQGQEEEAMT
jgi:hypothetical protein